MELKSVLKVFITIIITSIFINSCTENYSPDETNVVISNSETFEYKTVGGDEEDAVIVKQAKHFEISEIVRNASTNYIAVYKYKPKPGFIGADHAEIEIRKGSDGASEPTDIERVKFNFTIIE
jgi:hypothetical protein